MTIPACAKEVLQQQKHLVMDIESVLEGESAEKILLVFLWQFSVLTLFSYEQSNFPELGSDSLLRFSFRVLVKKNYPKFGNKAKKLLHALVLTSH